MILGNVIGIGALLKGTWSPLRLFSGGEDGAVLDATVLDSSFNDAAGTRQLNQSQQLCGVVNNEVRGPNIIPGAGYLEDSSTLLDDCSDLSSWSIAGAGSVIEDSVDYNTDGPGTLKFSGSTGNKYVTKNMTFNMSDGSPVLLGFYIPFTPTASTIGLTFYLSNGENLSGTPGRFFTTMSGIEIQTGYNLVPFYPSDFSVLDGTPSFDSDIKSIRLRLDTSAAREFYVDSVRIGYATRPKCVFTFDDGMESSYTEGFSYAQTKGFKLSHAIIASQVDAGGAITTAQLQEMETAGDEVSLHDDTNWPNLTTRAAIQTRIEGQLDAIEALGVARPTTAAYPENDYGSDNQALAQTVFSSLREAGVVLCRTGGSRICYPDRQNNYALYSHPLNNTTSLTAAKDQIDNAINYGATITFFGHILDTVAASTAWTISDWQDLLDYVKTKVDADLIDVVTLDAWRSGLSSAEFQVGSHADQVDQTKQPVLDIDGSSIYFLDFDGVDDQLTVNLSASVAATVAYVTAGGVTILTGQTTGAAYALPTVDWYACVVIDRALTVVETEQLILWLSNKANL